MPRKAPKTKEERVRHPKATPAAFLATVARVLLVLCGRKAYRPEECVSASEIASKAEVSVNEVIAAARGLVTAKYAVLPREDVNGAVLGYYLAASPQLAHAAEDRRERARKLIQEAKILEQLVDCLDNGGSVDV